MRQRTFSIALRLRLVTFAPLVGLALSGLWIVATLWAGYAETQRFPHIVNLVETSGTYQVALADEVSHAMHALAGSEGTLSSHDLEPFFAKTDAAKKGFDNAYSQVTGTTSNLLNTYQDAYERIVSIRQLVSEGKSNAADLVAYQKLGNALFSAVQPYILSVRATENSRVLAAMALFYEAREEILYSNTFAHRLIELDGDNASSSDALIAFITSLAKSSEALDGLSLALLPNEYTRLKSELSAIENMGWNDAIAGFTNDALEMPPHSHWHHLVTARLDVLNKFQAELVTQTLSDINSKVDRALGFIMIIVALLLALIILVTSFSMKEIYRIISSLTYVQQKLVALADGNLEEDLVEKRAPDRAQDELSSMYSALVLLKHNALEQRRLQEEKLRSAENENQRARIVSTIINDFKSTATTHIQELDAGMTDVRKLSSDVHNAAHSTLEKSNEASSDSTDSREIAISLAESAHDLSSEFGAISQKTNQLRQRTSIASQTASRIDSDVSELRTVGEQVRDVMTMISKIADQTALLAMNATIESARAGEAGRGFAVVASEVKALANQTSTSTEEIFRRVDEMMSAIDRTTSKISEVSKNIVDVDREVDNVTNAVDEQIKTLSNFSDKARDASGKSDHVSDNISDVSSIAKDTTSDAEAMKNRADTLAQRMHDMRAEIDQFLNRIEAA